MLRLINLKDEVYNVDYAIKTVEIEIENAKREGLIAIKVLHGYGSHGRGGAIMLELRRILPFWKRQGFIVDFFGGDKWSLFDKQSQEILNADKTIFGDCDLDNNNPGITIIKVS
ncbi:MAG: hypothetical protein E7379_03805 [Clostridiales bacterium]|nr:hypothetical protein [Clostridiales bacterium]